MDIRTNIFPNRRIRILDKKGIFTLTFTAGQLACLFSILTRIHENAHRLHSQFRAIAYGFDGNDR